MRHRVASKVGSAFRRGVHWVSKNGGAIRAVVGGTSFSFRARLTWTLVFTTSNKVLEIVSIQLNASCSGLLSSAHLSVPGKVDLQCLAVILKPEGCHGEQNILAVDGLSLLLLTFFRSW